MEFSTPLTEAAQQHVVRFFEERFPGTTYPYHDIGHTERVVRAAIEVGSHVGLSHEELELVVTAGWFHDVGYYRGGEGHELRSAEIAEGFLEGHGLASEAVETVKSCILATKMPQQPQTLLEEVLCDADLLHLAASDFFETSEKLRQEFSHAQDEDICAQRWNETSYGFLKEHDYFTQYARQTYGPSKAENLAALKPQNEKENGGKKKNKKKAKALEKEVDKLEQKLEKAEAKLDARPDRGIETMFRTTSRNHIDLSAIADNKANIIISVNSIIISLVISVSFSKLDTHPNLIFPTVLLLITSLTTIICAILSTRPNVTTGMFKREEIELRKTNLLFFGNFHGMPLEEFEWGIKEIMKDREFLYSSMIKDIYYLGVVLGRKYRFLRISYTLFMFGIILVVVSYIIAIGFYPDKNPLPPGSNVPGLGG